MYQSLRGWRGKKNPQRYERRIRSGVLLVGNLIVREYGCRARGTRDGLHRGELEIKRGEFELRIASKKARERFDRRAWL